jgi:hypothetical protein
MPNATCFLLAYALVLFAELARFALRQEGARRWATRSALVLFLVSLGTHTLYLVDRLWMHWGSDERGPWFGTWQDWGIFVAWMIAWALMVMWWRRSDKQIGLFVLPLILGLIGVSVAVPSVSPIASSQAATVSFWRLVHSVAMMVGTMLVTLGFASAAMYYVHAWKLKRRGMGRDSIRLPSLEYLQSMGRNCILGSAAAVGFGVVSGAVMNFTRDGQVAWTDRGIVFTGGLFLWLCFAAMAQRFSANRGRGEWTAAVNVLSFIIVVILLAMIVSSPHGQDAPQSLHESSSRVLAWLENAACNRDGGSA